MLNSPYQVSGHQLAMTNRASLLNAIIPAVLPVYYRNLQQVKNQLMSSGGYKNAGPLTKEAHIELKWCL